MGFENFSYPSPDSNGEPEPKEPSEQPDQICSLDRRGEAVYPEGVDPNKVTAIYKGSDGNWYVSTRPEIKKEMEAWSEIC